MRFMIYTVNLMGSFYQKKYYKDDHFVYLNL